MFEIPDWAFDCMLPLEERTGKVNVRSDISNEQRKALEELNKEHREHLEDQEMEPYDIFIFPEKKQTKV